MSEKRKGGDFLIQGSILAAASIIVRIIGLLFKIPMTNILGNKGIGYYNTAYEIYNLGLILSSYSLPLAVSKLIAARSVKKEHRNSKRIFNGAMAFATISGGIMTALLFWGADFIAAVIFNSEGSALPLKVMSPTILVFAIMGVLRGFFQGKNTMIPTSISQIIEQLVRAGVSIYASWYFMDKFTDSSKAASYGAAGGTLGTFAGAFVALLFLIFVYMLNRSTIKRQCRRDHTNYEEAYQQVFYALMITIVPIILSQTIYQLSGTVDNALFGSIMSGKGFTEDERMVMLGIYGGKYRLLSNVPVAIASALGTSMIPSIVASKVRDRHDEVKNKIKSTIKLNMLIAIPCAVGMGVLASPLMQLIFGDGKKLTSNLLMLGCSAVVFFSLSTVTNSVLQGIDLMRLSVTHSAISLVIHAGLVIIMLKYLNWGLYGMVIGNVSFALVICVLNWISIGRHLDYGQEVRTTFIMPLLCAAVMGLCAFLIYHGVHFMLHSNALSLLVAIPAAAIIYFVLILVLRVITEDELYEMPFGRSIAACSRKFHLI